MKVGLIGAAGFIGQRVLARALAAGHDVRALVRRPEALPQRHARLTVQRGDTFSPAAITDFVAGLDAVINVAGPPREGRHDSTPWANAARGLVRAMEQAHVDRLVAIAGAAARLPGESFDLRRAALRVLLERVVMPDVIRTKDLEVAAVAESSLSWTIVRPPRVGEGRPGRVTLSDTTLAGTRVDVEDLAAFIVGSLDSTTWARRAPTIATHS